MDCGLQVEIAGGGWISPDNPTVTVDYLMWVVGIVEDAGMRVTRFGLPDAASEACVDESRDAIAEVNDRLQRRPRHISHRSPPW